MFFKAVSIFVFSLLSVTSLPASALNDISETQIIQPSEVSKNEYFGNSISVDKDVLVVGANKSAIEPQVGAAYVFRKTNGEWIQEAKLIADDGSIGDHFGDSVAVSGNTIVIGAWGVDLSGVKGAGAAYVFQKIGNNWIQKQKLTPATLFPEQWYGRSVDISGATIVVGASGDDSGPEIEKWNTGAVYVYIGGAEWQQQAKLVVSTQGFSDFGRVVSVYNDLLAISSPGTNSVYIFSRTGNSWSEQTKITMTRMGSEQFGYSLDLGESDLIVGSSAWNYAQISSSGSSYIYSRNSGAWLESARLYPAQSTAGSGFGYSVSLFEESAYVGAPGYGGWPDYAGAVFKYKKNGSEWVEDARLIQTDPKAMPFMGHAVASSLDSAFSSPGTTTGVWQDNAGAVLYYQFGAAMLNVNISGSGTVTSSPSGINCGATCSASYNTGTSVALLPNPESGFSFSNWTGACSGSGSCTVVMDNAKTVGAVFAPIPKPVNHKLIVAKTGAGIVTSVPASISCGATCSGTFTAGSTVSLIAQPDNGFAFAGWGGACTSTGTCVVTMDGDKSVSANFIELSKYLVTVAKPSTGVVSSEPAGILCGGPNRQCKSSFSIAKLTAIPNAGYEFINWTGCQAPEGNICYIKPTGKMTVKAVFKKLPKYKIKIIKNTLGSIASTPSGLKCPDKKKTCEVSFVKGTEVALTAVPQAGRAFVGWTGSCSGTGSCNLLMDGSKGVGANFQ